MTKYCLLGMKYLYLLILASCSVSVTKAQQYQFKELVTNEIIQLNSASRPGGKTRDYLPLKLPAGCSGFVYSMNANNPNEPVESSFSLIAGLVALAGTGNMAISSAVSNLPIPAGTESADVYLIPSFDHIRNFLVKNAYSYIPDYSRTSRSSTKVFVPLSQNMQEQTIYLGLKNPSAFNKISITINAAAVFQE